MNSATETTSSDSDCNGNQKSFQENEEKSRNSSSRENDKHHQHGSASRANQHAQDEWFCFPFPENTYKVLAAIAIASALVGLGYLISRYTSPLEGWESRLVKRLLEECLPRPRAQLEEYLREEYLPRVGAARIEEYMQKELVPQVGARFEEYLPKLGARISFFPLGLRFYKRSS